MYSLTCFQIVPKLQIQGRMHIFEKISQNGLNHVLILQKDRTQKMLQIPLKIIIIFAIFNWKSIWNQQHVYNNDNKNNNNDNYYRQRDPN